MSIIRYQLEVSQIMCQHVIGFFISPNLLWAVYKIGSLPVNTETIFTPAKTGYFYS